MKRSIQNFDECILYLPDINIIAIQNIFQSIFDYASTEVNSYSIDWNIDPIENLFYKKFKREVNSKEVKEENDPIYFDTIYCKNDFEDIDLTAQSVKIEYETSEDEQLDSKKSILIRDCKVDLKQLKNVTGAKKKAKRPIKKKENKNVKKIIEHGSVFDVLDENMKNNDIFISNIEKSKTNFKNKRKRKAKINESLKDDSDLEYDIGNADPNCSESDSDAEINKEKKSVERKRRGKNEKKRIKLEELPNDEKVRHSNELMKNLLEDETNLTNPVPYIYQINALTIYDALPPSFMICPICMIQFSAVKVFAQHIQKHKLRTYKCPCLPNTNNQVVKEDHIKEIIINFVFMKLFIKNFFIA